MLPALEKAVALGRPVVIIAEAVDGEALATLVATLRYLGGRGPGRPRTSRL